MNNLHNDDVYKNLENKVDKLENTLKNLEDIIKITNNKLKLYEKKVEFLEENYNLLENKNEILENDIYELFDRIDDLEEDHVNYLFKECVCNNDGGDNKSCESSLHYCKCNILKKQTYNCRAEPNHHKCICKGLLVDWCLVHKHENMEKFIVNNKMQIIFNEYNHKTLMKNWIQNRRSFTRSVQ